MAYDAFVVSDLPDRSQRENNIEQNISRSYSLI